MNTTIILAYFFQRKEKKLRINLICAHKTRPINNNASINVNNNYKVLHDESNLVQEYEGIISQIYIE